MRKSCFLLAIAPLACGSPDQNAVVAADLQPFAAPATAMAWPSEHAPIVAALATADVPAPAAAKETDPRKPEPAADGPRIGCVGEHVRIWPKPSHEGLALGAMRMGTSIRLRKPDPVPADGCRRGWYEVEPRGYVCLNDRTTLDLNDPYYRALADVAPNRGVVWPYRYAHSRGAPMYSRVPTPAEWEQHERSLGPPGTFQDLGPWAKGHEELIEKERAIEATDPVPWYFEGGKRQVQGGPRDPRRLFWKMIPNGSMLAYGRAFEMHGRVWLVTADLTVVPADRVEYMRPSQFRGVELGGEVTLPLGWNRSKQPIALYRRDGEAMVASGETMPAKSWIEVGEERLEVGRESYLELRERPGMFLRVGKETTVTNVRPLPRSVDADEKWIHASITRGTFTAYRGTTPVYATLFSPGKGGLPVEGLDHTKYATTQIGHFRYEWKEWVATMSNEKDEPTVLWFSDVPHIQYVKAPLAQHVSYWHEDFGNPKSAECLNMSPLDGRWMFGFTEPQVPQDWNAIGPGRGFGLSTPIIITGM